MKLAVSRHVLVLAAVCGLTFFAGLGRPAISDSDEGFYAESAREMVERGDWLTPHFNYAHRFEKPVLYYWLAAGAYRLAGVGEAAARLPSALAGLGLTLLSFAVARRWFDDATGLLAGLIAATSFGHVALARQALPDLTLALLITVATWGALLAWLDPPRRRGALDAVGRRRWLIAAAVAAAGGVLAKGPVALALPALVVAPLVCGEYLAGRSRWHPRRAHLAAAGVAFLLVAAPWFVGMTIVHGVDYLARFFVAENLERFATPRYNAPRAWWYYLPIAVGGMLPWSPYMLLWLPALGRFAARTRSIDAATSRLAWWALAPLLFYTLSVGKQPRYILPMLSPLAVLLAATLREQIGRAQARGRLLTACTTLAGSVLVLLGMLVHRARPLLVEWEPLWTTALAAAMGAAGIGVCLTVGRRRWTPAALAAAATVAVVGVHSVLLASPGPAPVERIASMIAANRAAGEHYGRHAVFDRNLVFYTRAAFVDLPVLQAASDFLRGPARVLCVLTAEDADRLAAQGVRFERLGQLDYLNTGTLNLRMLLAPRPDYLQRVVLVTNRQDASAPGGVQGPSGVSASPGAVNRRGGSLPTGGRKDLAGIEDPVRVEGGLEPPHQGDRLVGQLQPEIRRLGAPDAVLAADRAPEAHDLLEQPALRRPGASRRRRIARVQQDVDVDVAVPDVAEAGHAQAGRAPQLADYREQFRDSRPGHHDVVVDLERRLRPQGERQVAARPPEPGALRRAAGQPHAGGPLRLARAPHALGFGGHRFRHPVDLHQQHRARFLVHHAPPRGGRQHVQTVAVEQLDRGRHDPLGDQAAHRLRRLVDGPECGADRRPRRRLRDQPQDDPGDDRQRAFRADQQLRQVVTDDVLDRPAAGRDDLAGRQHRLQSQHVAPGRAVLERPRAAGAFGHVAADHRPLQAGRVRRIEQADLLDRPLQARGDDVRLHDRQQTAFVDLEDPVQPLHRQHHAAGGGHRAAGVSGPGAARGQRYPFAVAQPRHR